MFYSHHISKKLKSIEGLKILLGCTFKGAQRQIDWLEISIVYVKSNQHTTIYDSYDLELAARLIRSLKFENTSSGYSLTGKLLYDLEKEDDKHLIYKMFVALL